MLLYPSILPSLCLHITRAHVTSGLIVNVTSLYVRPGSDELILFIFLVLIRMMLALDMHAVAVVLQIGFRFHGRLTRQSVLGMLTH